MLTEQQKLAQQRDQAARAAVKGSLPKQDWDAEVQRANSVNARIAAGNKRAWEKLAAKLSVEGRGNPVGLSDKPKAPLGEGCRRATIPKGLWRGV